MIAGNRAVVDPAMLSRFRFGNQPWLGGAKLLRLVMAGGINFSCFAGMTTHIPSVGMLTRALYFAYFGRVDR